MDTSFLFLTKNPNDPDFLILSWILGKKRSLRFNFFNRLSVNFEKQLQSFVYPYLRFMWAPVDKSLRPYIKNSMFSYGQKKKPLQKPCTINLAQRRIQNDRDQTK